MNLQEALDDLQNLDPNNVGAWPTFAYVGSCILLIAVIIIGGFYYKVEPLQLDLERVQSQETELRAEFERKQLKAANLQAYRDQLAEMERSFGSMLRQLPSKTEVANLLNDISQTRVAAGLEEQLFQPQGEIPRDFYAVLPNKITVSGSYHEMAEFVSRVAALPRIVTVSDVHIRAGKGRDLIMDATINTYRYLDADEGGVQ